MGQKVNPIGLRLGVSRKWSFSWYFPNTVQKSLDSAQSGLTLLSHGVVASRGGFIRSSFEELFRNFFSRFLIFSNKKYRRYFPIHIQVRKGVRNHLFFFIFYVKLIGRNKRKKLHSFDFIK